VLISELKSNALPFGVVLGYNQRLRSNLSDILINQTLRFLFARPLSFQGATMAVQQNKKSPSKRGMHRSHNALNVPGIAVEPTTGEIHLRHHISPNGFYRGRQVLKNKSEA
jgi:large subunit ribosomal protein L32